MYISFSLLGLRPVTTHNYDILCDFLKQLTASPDPGETWDGSVVNKPHPSQPAEDPGRSSGNMVSLTGD